MLFPRIIKVSEEKALIWDQTYWELFSLYLAYFTDLNAIQKKIIVYDESSVQQKILIPFAYYLALIVEDKGEENVLDHHMHSEFYRIDEEAAEKINNARKNNGRIIAVGTTSTRTLESVAKEDGTIEACSGWTQIFIYPGYKFKAIDCLITNFHLPESTLVMLVSALAGRENVLNAYETAVKEKYRFFSFGDAMFIK